SQQVLTAGNGVQRHKSNRLQAIHRDSTIYFPTKAPKRQSSIYPSKSVNLHARMHETIKQHTAQHQSRSHFEGSIGKVRTSYTLLNDLPDSLLITAPLFDFGTGIVVFSINQNIFI